MIFNCKNSNKYESGVCGMECIGRDYYFQKNMLGDICAIYNALGELVCRYVYDAWGNHKIYDKAGNEIPDDGSTVASINPFRYRGYYWDREFKLYYLKSRYYDPEVGRFISPDSIEYLDPASISGMNLYAYCGNNPVMYTDPEGHLFFTLLFGFLIGAVISAAVEINNQVNQYGWDASNWDWKQIGLSSLGGGVAGVISAIPLGGAIGAFILGGVGAVAGGVISGTVTDFDSGLRTFMVGSFANLIGYGVAKGIENFRVNNIMKLSPNAKSAAIWELFGTDPSSLSKGMRYLFSQYTREQVSNVVRGASTWLRYGIQSSFVSTGLSIVGG